MGVTTALSNGISGLLALGDALNVIGDNLANVNTTGFKASLTEFETVFSQTISGGSGPSAELFGTNPSQLGLGVTTATIRRNFSQGPLASTGNPNDLAILGRGFFILGDAVGGDLSYTRDGSFAPAEDGTISDPATGLAVLGFTAVDGAINVSGTPAPIVIPAGLSTAQATENAFFNGNLDASGDIAVDGNTNTGPALEAGGGAAAGAGTLLTALEFPTGTNLGLAVGDVLTLNADKGTGSITPQTFTVVAGSTLGDLATFMQTSLGLVNGTVTISGTGELVVTSDVGTDNLITDITLSSDGAGATAFNNLFDPLVGGPFTTTTATQPGESFTVSGLTVFDTLGNTVPLTVTFVRTAPLEVTYFAESPFGQAVGNGTITYDANGQFVSAVSSTGGTAVATIPRTGTGAADPLIVNLDFSQTSFLAGASNLALNTQDGFPLGDLEDIFVGIDGTITGRFTNGLTQLLGQFAIATFNNPNGLVSVGENRFVVSANSGDAQVGVATVGGRGSIASGFLEGSNTDLAREFTNTIVVQRGFQANARTITTADTLLQELINLIR